MSLPIPNLDDRSFDDLLQEAKSLIPIYNKEWTNHNPSDPGITLVELFAWLSEMTMYRLNQIPEENYRVFLKLLGIDYLFHWDGAPGVDSNRLCGFLAQNYNFTWVEPVNMVKSADDQTLLISDANNRISLSLTKERNQVLVHFNGINDEFDVNSENLFCWENIPGIDENKLLEFINETFEMTKTALISKEASGSEIVVSEVGKRVLLTLSPNRDFVTINSYDGRTSQLMVTKKNERLNITRLKIYQPLTKDIRQGLASLSQCYRAITTADFETLTLECLRTLQPDLNGRVFCMMNRDLEYSKSSSVAEKPGHVTVMMVVSGEKPVFSWDDLLGQTIPLDIINFLRLIYGIDWVAPNTSKRIELNRVIITKTDDSETITFIRRGDTQVVVVCPGFLPDQLAIRYENKKPYLYAYETNDSKPSLLLIRKVKRFLSQRKLLGTRVHVIAPDYFSAKVEAKIVSSPNTNPETVKQAAIEAVEQYLSPMTGGDAGMGWPPGRFIRRSELYHLLEGVSGVDHVASLTFAGQDVNQVEILPYQLIDPNHSQISIEVIS